MREVARRAGVAVAAPAHHFDNAKGLLTAIATCAFEKLTAEQMKAMEWCDLPHRQGHRPGRNLHQHERPLSRLRGRPIPLGPCRSRERGPCPCGRSLL